MPNSQAIPWKRLIAEGGAIIVSILLAFSIDAWWDNRQDHDDEQIVLAALLPEFQQIRDNIQDIRTFQVAIRAAAIRLAELSVNPAPSISDRDIDYLLEEQFWSSSPANFHAPELSDAMQKDLDFQKTTLEPFLFDNLSFLQLSVVDQQRPGDPDVILPRVAFESNTFVSNRGLLQNRRFQNFMLHRSTLLDNIIGLAHDPALPDRVEETIVIIVIVKGVT